MHMRVSDLFAEPLLDLRLETPSGPERLQREIIRCAPTEHLDPTPFLEPNVLLLTSGIGMNFTAQSIWDAYVERLTRISIAAIGFAVGAAHPSLPRGLVDACTKHDVPLLEIPTTVPLLRIDQHVENVLAAERFELHNASWKLADECARLASQGAEVKSLLAAIHAAINRPIAVYDSFDMVIAQYPETATWKTGALRGEQPDLLTIPLPMGLQHPCTLAVQLLGETGRIERLLTPAASILALQVGRSVVVDASSHQEMRRFIEHCMSWSDSTRSDVGRGFQDLGLNKRTESSIVVASTHGEHAAWAWRLRVALHDCFYEVRLAELDDRLVAIAQYPRRDLDLIHQQILHLAPALPLVLRAPSSTIDELRIGLVHALDLVSHVTEPTLAPTLGLSAVIAAVAGRGAREAASRFLAPLLTHESSRESELLLTLRTWLRHDAQPSRACEELFIHRNSLSYRLRNIEKLLGVPLDSLESRATCLMALRLVDIEPY